MLHGCTIKSDYFSINSGGLLYITLNRPKCHHPILHIILNMNICSRLTVEFFIPVPSCLQILMVFYPLKKMIAYGWVLGKKRRNAFCLMFIHLFISSLFNNDQELYLSSFSFIHIIISHQLFQSNVYLIYT